MSRAGSSLRCSVLACVATLLAATSPVAAQCQRSKLLAANGAAGDYFGQAISIRDDRVIVGAYRQETHGAAYIFQLDRDASAWAQTAFLRPTDLGQGGTQDGFGFAVAIDGDVAVIGARLQSAGVFRAGAAYVYRFDGDVWVQQEKLLASDRQIDDRFGWSVAIDDDTIIVGAMEEDQTDLDSGAAYVFRYDRRTSSWSEEAKLLASDGLPRAFFGFDVGISGDVAIVGAWGHEALATTSDSVYVFRFDPETSAWVEEAKLPGSPAGSFGMPENRPYSIDGDVIVMGGQFDGTNGPDAGSAYIYAYDGGVWTQQAHLTKNGGSNGALLGWSTSVRGDLALAGAPLDDDNGVDSGSCCLFRLEGDQWSVVRTLTSTDGTSFNHFGWSTAIDMPTIVVGAVTDNDNGLNSGSAYPFAVPGQDCNGNAICDAVDVQTGTSDDLNGDGIPDECTLSPCELADVTGDLVVDIDDLVQVILDWGSCPVPPAPCRSDVDLSGSVDVDDLLQVLLNWGSCV